MRPRPGKHTKIIITVAAALLVIAAVVVTLISAFGGQSSQPSTPDQPPAQDHEVQDNPEVQTPPQFFVDEDEKGDESDEPVQKPSNTEPDLAEKNPDGEQKPEPPVKDPEPTQKDTVTVQMIWDGMEGSMGEVPEANMTLSDINLQELYGIDPKICDEFILKKAGTVVSPEEFLIVKASEANLSVIEQACQQRQIALTEQWAAYGEQMQLIENYQIARAGNYLFFGVSSRISQLVGIFQGIMLTA